MNFDKRLSAIENRLNPKPLPRATIAYLKSNGKVELCMPDREILYLPDVEALNEYQHQNKGLPVLRIEFMRPHQG